MIPKVLGRTLDGLARDAHQHPRIPKDLLSPGDRIIIRTVKSEYRLRALGSDLYFDPELSGFIGGYYWPDGILRDDTVTAWIQLFELHGYQECDTGELEPRAEKIAIYVDAGGEAQHVAKQLPSGAWSSKLGKLEDIEHQTLAAIVSGDYGSVLKFMKRSLG